MNVFAVLCSIGTHGVISSDPDFSIKQSFNCGTRMSGFTEGFWGDVVLHDEMRVQTVKVKTDNPII